MHFEPLKKKCGVCNLLFARPYNNGSHFKYIYGSKIYIYLCFFLRMIWWMTAPQFNQFYCRLPLRLKRSLWVGSCQYFTCLTWQYNQDPLPSTTRSPLYHAVPASGFWKLRVELTSHGHAHELTWFLYASLWPNSDITNENSANKPVVASVGKQLLRETLRWLRRCVYLEVYLWAA